MKTNPDTHKHTYSHVIKDRERKIKAASFDQKSQSAAEKNQNDVHIHVLAFQASYMLEIWLQIH